MGIIERKLREKKERRQLILDAAARKLLEVGVENATMAEIAEEAELSKGALYLYFRSKESLVYALLHSILLTFRDRITGATDVVSDGHTRVAAMRQAYIEVYAEYSRFLGLFQYLDYRSHGAEEDESGAWRCFHVIDEIKEHLVSVLELGQRDGSLRAGFNARKTAEMQVHMVESFLQRIAARDRFIKERSEFTPEELVFQMFEMIEFYLKPEMDHQTRT